MTMVSQVPPGSIFRMQYSPNEHEDFKLIHVNFCRAYVERLGKQTRVIKVNDDLSDITGADEITREFRSSGARINIAPGAECVFPIPDGPMTYTTTTEKENKMTTATTHKRGGDRHYEPTAQERPVREGTTRAKILAALLGGEKDINKLMKKFDMNRNLLVAHVHEMWKCHGYGYSVVGDAITIKNPTKTKAPAKPAPADDDLGDIL